MATSVANTGWSSFLSDKANTAWWVWTATDSPELWTTRARPFWARTLTKLGRTVDPEGPISVTKADIALLRTKLVEAGMTPKFPADQGIVDAEVARAAAWYTFHAPLGTPDDLWFPRTDEAGEIVQGPLLGATLIGSGEATSAPETRQLGTTGEDITIRKSVGLDVPVTPAPGTSEPSGTGTPQGGSKGINWGAVAAVAAVVGVAWWAFRDKDDQARE